MSQYPSIVPQSDTFLPMLDKLPKAAHSIIAEDLYHKMQFLRWQQGLLADSLSEGRINCRSFLKEMLEQVSKDFVSASNILYSLRRQLPNFQPPEIHKGSARYRIVLTTQKPNLIPPNAKKAFHEIRETPEIREKELLLSTLYGCVFRFTRIENGTTDYGNPCSNYFFEGHSVFSDLFTLPSRDIMKHLKDGDTFQVGHPECI